MSKMVMVYPTEPVGEATVRGVSAEPQEVSAERAAELMAYFPFAFTTNKDGSPTEEQRAREAGIFEDAWGKDEPKPAHLVSIEPKRLTAMTLAELRAEAAARGLDASGKKAELLERIQNHDAAAAEAAGEANPEPESSADEDAGEEV